MEKRHREEYLDTHLTMMIRVGLTRPVDVHPILRTFFILRTILLFVVYSVLITGCCAHIKMVNKYDLLASSINILQLVIYFMAVLHIGYFELKHKDVHILILSFRKAFRSASNTGHYTTVEAVRLDKRRSVGWTAVCSVATIGWFFMAMARGENPVPIWAPVNLDESPYYEINVILQFIGQAAVGTIGGCFGSFYFSVLSLVRDQFKLLSYSLEHVAPLTVLKMQRRIHDGKYMMSSMLASKYFGINTSDVKIMNSHQCECCTEKFKRFFRMFEKRRFENALTPLETFVYEKELDNTLIDCIVHHQNIVQLKDILDGFLGPVIFIRFILSTLMLCFIIYSTSKLTAREDFSPADMTFISLVEYYFVGVVELFGFCIIAERLSLKSVATRDKAFENLPWHGGKVSKKFISTFKFFHMNATKPTSLRTSFYVVSMNLLISMLRSSFSFYTLLRRLQNE